MFWLGVDGCGLQSGIAVMQCLHEDGQVCKRELSPLSHSEESTLQPSPAPQEP